MKYGKSKLLSILRLPLTRQMLRDLVDSLWRDPVGDRHVTALTFDEITRILTLTQNHGLADLTALVPGGSGGGGETAYISETPAGDVDGINTAFNFSEIPVAGSLLVFLNGQRQKYGIDYTLPAGVLTFATAPFTGDIITADYKYNAPGVVRVIDAAYTGEIDGDNTDFVLSVEPVAVYVYLNGSRLKGGVDYTFASYTVSLTTAPYPGDILIIDIEYVNT